MQEHTISINGAIALTIITEAANILMIKKMLEELGHENVTIKSKNTED